MIRIHFRRGSIQKCLICVIAATVVSAFAICGVGKCGGKNHKNVFIPLRPSTPETLHVESACPAPPDWRSLLEFVPYGVHECSHLFANVDKQNPFLGDRQYHSSLLKFENHVAAFKMKRPPIEEYLLMHRLGSSSFLNTYCETGLDGGYSVFAWLQSNQSNKAILFDTGRNIHHRLIIEFLVSIFPRRLNITWGDTSSSIPRFYAKYSSAECDVMKLNNEPPTYDGVRSEYEHFRQMAARTNMIILNGYPTRHHNFTSDLGKVWEDAKHREEVLEFFKCSHSAGISKNGFVVGRFNNRCKKDH